MKRRIGIVGSPDSLSDSQMPRFLEIVWGARNGRGIIVTTDDKTGAPAHARHHCPLLGVEIVEHALNPAYGKVAVAIRNQRVIEDAHELHAFWDGKGRGMADAIKQARLTGMTVRVYKP